MIGYLTIGLLVLPVQAGAGPAEPSATVKGRIVWAGKEIPKPKLLDVPGLTLPDETWVVHPKSKGLRDAFVWLDSPGGKMPINPAVEKVKGKPAYLNPTSFVFVPHVLAPLRASAEGLHLRDSH